MTVVATNHDASPGALDEQTLEPTEAHICTCGLGRLKPWGGLATRLEWRAVNDRAVLALASIVLWLKP
ncbi:MAG: hypothetical protein ACHQ1E_05965 [Ktedonobacterales bacterium]|jgi:hypothetical protein